jgi:hypothetical protein
MAESKQISATLNIDVVNDVFTMSANENRSFSQMVETLLMEALVARTIKGIKAKKDRIK